MQHGEGGGRVWGGAYRACSLNYCNNTEIAEQVSHDGGLAWVGGGGRAGRWLGMHYCLPQAVATLTPAFPPPAHPVLCTAPILLLFWGVRFCFRIKSDQAVSTTSTPRAPFQ